MCNSDRSLAMTRIILEFLLIFACGGFVIHTAGEEPTVSAIAEKITNKPTEESLKTHDESLSKSESSTLSSTEKGSTDVTINTSQITHDSPTPLADEASKQKENLNYTSEEESEKISTQQTSSSSKTESVDDSKTVSSDVDYGGKNTGPSTYSPSTELVTEEKIQKSELQKYSQEKEFVTLKSDSSITTDETKNKDQSSNKSFDDENSTNTIETTPLASSVQQKVSASPKSATNKRSLNSSNALFNKEQTSTPTNSSPLLVTSPNTSAWPNPNFARIDATTKTEPESEKLEELPTPLPLEIIDNSDAETVSPPLELYTGQLFSTEKQLKNEDQSMSSRPLLESNISTTADTSQLSNNIGVVTYTTRVSDTTEWNKSDGVTFSQEKKYETNPNSSKYTIDESSKTHSTIYSYITPNGILAPESDDIIYAGFADDEPLGVTFDPDGMKNDFPQDPDSIIFSVPPKVMGKMSTENTNKERENLSLETTFVENESTKPWNSKPLPHDAPESEFEVFNGENSSNVDSQLVQKSNHSESLVLPEVIHNKVVPTSNEFEEMLQDSPFIDDTNDSHVEPFHSTAVTMNKMTTKEKDSVKDKENFTAISHATDPSVQPAEAATELLKKENEYIIHHTEQSVIRPVKVISPAAESATSTVQPRVSLPISTEFSNAPSTESEISASSTTKQDTSSPIILPNPAPSIIEKLDKEVESTSAIAQPELDETLPNLNKTQNDSNGNLTLTNNANSTIESIDVKTSVSISVPLSKDANVNSEIHNTTEFSTSSDANMISSTLLSNKDSSAVSTFESSTETTTNTPNMTTTASKIRKPGIRVPGRTGDPEVRTRKPFTPTYKRPSTTVGPPVSIFKKSRTRVNSITSSTTSRPLSQFSTIRVHYASRMPGMKPGGELFVSVEPITTTVPPTTTTEEPISEVPFTDQTYTPILPTEDDVTLVKVGGGIVLENGLRWTDQLSNRQSPQYKEKATQIHLHLERLFRSSPIASRLWKIEIDGFNGTKYSRSVEVDFFLYLIKSADKIALEHLAKVFHEKLSSNNTFARYRVDPSRTAFEMLQEEPMNKPTISPEDHYEPPIPQWAIAVVVICAASLIFIILFAAVTMYGRHHMRRRYGNKLNEDDLDRSSGEWESKMTAAYENMAADTIYDAEDLPGDTYKKTYIVD